MPSALSRNWLLVLAPAALAAAGCGLSDYEKKMQEADARLQRFDAENALLGEPLALPTGDAALPADLFLRPPKGIAKNPEDPKQAPLRYPAKDGVCTELYLWVGAKDDDAAKLKQRVQAWLGQADVGWQPYVAQPPYGRPAVTFDWAQVVPANAAVFRAYVRPTASGAPVALVFKLAQPAPSNADEALKMSLETYTESEAAKARSDWSRWRAH